MHNILCRLLGMSIIYLVCNKGCEIRASLRIYATKVQFYNVRENPYAKGRYENKTKHQYS